MIALFLAVAAAIELARRLPLLAAFRRMARSSARAGKLLQRKASEHRKERAMRALSFRLLHESLFAGLLLLAVASPIGAALLLDRPFGLGVAASLFDWPKRLLLFLLCLGYAIVRTFAGRQLQRR